ncbi:MAG: MinD/ParA family protein [Ignavibacteriales bacterium]|nr:MAG: MinD/ParA family protein [Ignavibacteriales bacterium]
MLGQAKRLYELQNLMLNNNSASNDVPVITFTSGKGGTGKSFVCLNLAYLLSSNYYKVLVVDFDLNFANLHTLVNVIPQKTYYDYLNSGVDVKELITNYNSNLDFLFGFSGKDEDAVDPVLIRNLIKEIKSLAGNYDFILFDTSSGGSDLSLEILASSTQVIVITNPEPTSVLDSYAIIKLLTEKNENINLQVIVNKVLKKEDADYTFNNLNTSLQHFLKKQVNYFGFIPFDLEVMSATFNQTIFVEQKPALETSRCFIQLSQKLTKIKQVANINHP